VGAGAGDVKRRMRCRRGEKFTVIKSFRKLQRAEKNKKKVQVLLLKARNKK
jgi:hypothetical protein